VGARVVGLLLAAGRGRRFAAARAADRTGRAAGRDDAAAAGDDADADGRDVRGRARRPPADAARPDDKLLAPVDGAPVARRALEALSAGCDAVVAVVGPHASPALRDALAGARLVECADADLGMGHSLAAGARAAAGDGADAVLVMPADMPWLAPGTARAIAEAAREGEAGERALRIVVPVLADGRRGHPVAFGAAHLPALARLTGDRGARALLDAHPTRVFRTDDAGILRDVDTPRDLPAP
jgi:molybdenum cofactor cytidylyltransferase